MFDDLANDLSELIKDFSPILHLLGLMILLRDVVEIWKHREFLWTRLFYENDINKNLRSITWCIVK